jgi:hypothetical protein
VNTPQFPEFLCVKSIVQRYLGKDLLVLTLQQQCLRKIHRNRSPVLSEFDRAAQFFFGGRPVAGGNGSTSE